MDVTLEQLPAEWQQEFQRLQQENHLLRLQLKLALIARFGKKSEKLSDAQLQLLQEEPSVTEAEVAQEAAQPPPPASPAANQPPRRKPARPASGRMELPAHLERREQIIPCADPRCSLCQKETKVIGYETKEELDVDPAIYFVRVIKREKRACLDCPEAGVQTAPVPARIIPKGLLGDALVIDSLIKKFDEHLPVYRQCMILQRDAQLQLSRQTLVEPMMKVGELLQALRQVLIDDLKTKGYIQADETTVPCMSERTKGRNHQAYMWEYSRPGGPVVFDFQMGRGREGPKEFLKGFVGILQVDGYRAYDKLGEGIIYAGCLAHARREFYQAHQVAKEDPVPLEILGRMAELYKIEEQARAQGMDFAQRLALRQQQSRPLMDQLKERLVAIRQQVLPQSLVGRACDYTLRQWSRLEVFLQDGRVEIDNNWCENAIRPIALGRKNWLHIGSEQAGPRIAAIVSIMETCRRLGINVRAYLSDILPKLADWPIKRVAELSPMAWQAAHPNH